MPIPLDPESAPLCECEQEECTHPPGECGAPPEQVGDLWIDGEPVASLCRGCAEQHGCGEWRPS